MKKKLLDLIKSIAFYTFLLIAFLWACMVNGVIR